MHLQVYLDPLRLAHRLELLEPAGLFTKLVVLEIQHSEPRQGPPGTVSSKNDINVTNVYQTT